MQLQKLKGMLLVLCSLGVFGLPLQADAVIHNMAAQWSDVSNPNGLWSYQEGNTPIPHSGYLEEIGGPVWYTPGSVAVAFKVTVNNPSGYDLLSGDTGVHGGYGAPVNLTWTCNVAGIARVRGNAWLVRNLGRNMYWGIVVNGVEKTSGHLPAGIYSRAVPFDFQNGSGGPEALNFGISPGTTITLALWQDDSTWTDFVGVNFTIDATPGQVSPGILLLLDP